MNTQATKRTIKQEEDSSVAKKSKDGQLEMEEEATRLKQAQLVAQEPAMEVEEYFKAVGTNAQPEIGTHFLL